MSGKPSLSLELQQTPVELCKHCGVEIELLDAPGGGLWVHKGYADFSLEDGEWVGTAGEQCGDGFGTQAEPGAL